MANGLSHMPGDPSSGTAEVVFGRHRRRLFGLAYRMLGSRAEAEDVVQDAYVRWHQADRDAIQNPEAWLVTTASRLALDRLRALKSEREAYQGPWLPEPLMGMEPPPDRRVELAADLSVAFLVLLERLAPEERAAFLLHEVFECEYRQIARVLDKSEAACRQIVHRARERVRQDRKRFEASDAARENLLRRFVAAVEARDEQALLDLLAPDVTWTADGGGRVPAAPRPIVGAERVIRLVLGLQAKYARSGATLHLAAVNGETGLCLRLGGRLVSVFAVETDGRRLSHVYVIVNPEKLGSASVQ
ncbi:MAG TPA: RNA polymerase sigma-70 factor [Vicinamibacterales bacterium]|nr:RNA polymerase sigma-70 factor [Vicinamibacterales bacterium]